MNVLARTVLGLTCLVVSAAGVRGAVDLQNLVDRSPFAPVGQAAGPTQPTEQATLEFRGVVTDEGGTAYSIFDLSNNKGRWVRADDTNSPVRVLGYDASSGTLELEQNGQTMRLTLKRSTIQAGQPVVGAQGAVPIPAAMPGQPNEVRPPGDARRLEAVAAEVRRRRALRNAASNQPQAQSPAAAPAAPKPASP